MKRSLPPKANAGHLKKQAKSLRNACLAGDGRAKERMIQSHPRYAAGNRNFQEVRLQEAQLVIAREYGFSSWPVLIKALGPEARLPAASSADVLLFTNGRSAIERLEQAGVAGDKFEWLEVLHEGPVPKVDSAEELRRIRAAHFTGLEWATLEAAEDALARRDAVLEASGRYRELQLWFEHDLYDQLQVIQMLDRLAALPGWADRIMLYQFDTYLGRLNPEQLRMPHPQPVDARCLQLGRRVWEAFCGTSPQALADLRKENLDPLPFLDKALLRLCQEFPSLENGLGRTESQALTALAGGPLDPESLFRINQDQESAIFFGDAAFYALVQRLNAGPRPLIQTASGSPFLAPAQAGYTEAFRGQQLSLTATGAAVLRGDVDRLETLAAPYWLGGTKIADARAPRWEAGRGRFATRAA